MFTIALVGLAFTLALGLAPSAKAGPLLKDGQTVVAKFSSGTLKGKTFRLRYKEKKGLLKDRPVTEHTAKVLAIKTPGGWCRFASGGTVECHNGKGTWRAK